MVDCCRSELVWFVLVALGWVVCCSTLRLGFVYCLVGCCFGFVVFVCWFGLLGLLLGFAFRLLFGELLLWIGIAVTIFAWIGICDLDVVWNLDWLVVVILDCLLCLLFWIMGFVALLVNVYLRCGSWLFWLWLDYCVLIAWADFDCFGRVAVGWTWRLHWVADFVVWVGVGCVTFLVCLICFSFVDFAFFLFCLLFVCLSGSWLTWCFIMFLTLLIWFGLYVIVCYLVFAILMFWAWGLAVVVGLIWIALGWLMVGEFEFV